MGRILVSVVGLYVQPSIIQKHASICVDTFSEESTNAMMSQEALDEHLTGDSVGGGVFQSFQIQFLFESKFSVRCCGRSSERIANPAHVFAWNTPGGQETDPSTEYPQTN